MTCVYYILSVETPEDVVERVVDPWHSYYLIRGMYAGGDP